MNKLTQLAIDIARGSVTEFSTNEANEALRQELVTIVGTDKIGFKQLRKHGTEIFEILEEALDILVADNVEAEFGTVADVRNIAFGDSNVFDVENPELFKVATIADGNNNIRRQRLENGKITVATELRGVKVYEEFVRLLSGRTDWVKVVAKVSKSYITDMYLGVYGAIYDSFSDLGSIYGKSGSYSSTVLDELIDHTQAASGGLDVMIMGTKTALSKINNGQISDSMKDAYNKQGFFGEYNGTMLKEIKQTHRPGTDEFALDGNFLVVVPIGGEKMVKIVIEGEAVIIDADATKNADMSQEYTFMKKAGIVVVAPCKYAIYKITG